MPVLSRWIVLGLAVSWFLKEGQAKGVLITPFIYFLSGHKWYISLYLISASTICVKVSFLPLPQANTLYQVPLASSLDSQNRITVFTCL